MENINWKEVEPNVWKPEKEGDSIEGVLIRTVTKDDDKDLSARYYIENKDGTFLVWGSTVLDDRMGMVTIGTIVKIEYKGKAKNKKNQDVKIFKVLTATNAQA